MTDEQVYAGVEKALRKYFGKRGDQVVQDNLTCVKRGYSEMKEIPQDVISYSDRRADGVSRSGCEPTPVVERPTHATCTRSCTESTMIA